MKRFLSIMFNGIMFAIPLGIVIYLFSKIVTSLERLVEPLANAVGVQRLLGEFALLIISVVIIMLFCFVLGLLLQRAAVLRVVGDSIEGFAVRVIPSLGLLKSMAGEKLQIQVADACKGILLAAPRLINNDTLVPGIAALREACAQAERQKAMAALRRLVPEYHPAESELPAVAAG